MSGGRWNGALGASRITGRVARRLLPLPDGPRLYDDRRPSLDDPGSAVPGLTRFQAQRELPDKAAW